MYDIEDMETLLERLALSENGATHDLHMLVYSKKNIKYNIIALLSFCQFDTESLGKKE